MPRLDLLLNNIVAYLETTGYCGAPTALCITSTNQTANRPIQTAIHGMDGALGLTPSRMDGNVYANGTGSIIRVSGFNAATPSSWTSWAAGSPVRIAGLEAHGKSGNTWVNPNGSPTPQLDHSQAVAVPNDHALNLYVPAGTKHFGWLK